jgi:hypothetical protein
MPNTYAPGNVCLIHRIVHLEVKALVNCSCPCDEMVYASDQEKSDAAK